jgi:hypothetical protein
LTNFTFIRSKSSALRSDSISSLVFDNRNGGWLDVVTLQYGGSLAIAGRPSVTMPLLLSKMAVFAVASAATHSAPKVPPKVRKSLRESF